jgi:hypothetical protein
MITDLLDLSYIGRQFSEAEFIYKKYIYKIIEEQIWNNS